MATEYTPRVLLHGFTGAPASWNGVIDGNALALPGHAPDFPVPDTFESAVDQLIHQFPETPVHLIGYSLGARLGLGLLARHPTRIARASLIGVHPGLDSDSARAQRRLHDRVWIDLLQNEGIEAFVEQWERLPLFETQTEAHRTAQRSIRLSHNPMQLAAALEVLGLAEMPDYRHVIGKAEVIAGEHDTKFRALHSNALLVRGAGHNVLLEQPEALGRLLQD